MANKYNEEPFDYTYDEDSQTGSVYVKPDHDDYDGSSISSRSEYKKRQKALEEYKKLDKGYHKLSRVSGGERFSVPLYTTSYCPGIRIRNAVSGIYEDGLRTGCKDEDLFFVVILATGETGPTPPHLYYDNPEQYERHFRCVIPQDAKDRWRIKSITERQRRANEMEREERRQQQRTGILVK
jgi:hypothetical protein